MVESLQRHGLIEPRETVKDGRRPERTVYGITEAGRLEFVDWLTELISTPVKEYPQFEAGLSLIGGLTPGRCGRLLELRCRPEHESPQHGVDPPAASSQELPRLFLIEADYRTPSRRPSSSSSSWRAEISGGSLEGVEFWREFHRQYRPAGDDPQHEQPDPGRGARTPRPGTSARGGPASGTRPRGRTHDSQRAPDRPRSTHRSAPCLHDHAIRPPSTSRSGQDLSRRRPRPPGPHLRGGARHRVRPARPERRRQVHHRQGAHHAVASRLRHAPSSPAATCSATRRGAPAHRLVGQKPPSTSRPPAREPPPAGPPVRAAGRSAAPPGRRAARPLRPGRRGRAGHPHLQRRDAAQARRGHGAGAPARGAVPRRADHRPRPRGRGRACGTRSAGWPATRA